MRRTLGFALVVGLSITMPSTAAQSQPRDLQGLIDSAPEGATLILEPGIYSGNVTIAKSITIEGSPSAIVDAGGAGSAFDIGAADVAIRGITIRNTGNSLDRENAGISAREAPGLIVENCTFERVLFGIFLRQSPGSTIRNNLIGGMDFEPGRRGDAIRVWETNDTLITGNVVDGGRDSVMWYSDGLVVADNVFTNGRYGLHFMYSHDATITNNVLEGNSVGGFLMYSKNLTFTGNFVAGNFGPSGYGLGMKEVDGAQVADNQFVGNRIGIYFDYTPISYDIVQRFTGNLVAYNEVGLLFLPNVERNEFSANAFVENREQVGITSGGEFTGNAWTIDGVGNHWDDFGGYDADGDGIGDIPYKLDDLYSALTDTHPEITFFADTPAARAVDMAARIFPSLRPRPKVIDEAPLVEMPDIVTSTRADGAPVAAMLTMSLLMLASAATVVAVSHRKIGVIG
jgi:nitrous oxidase accessory protein